MRSPMEGANEGHFDWDLEQGRSFPVAANEAAAWPQRGCSGYKPREAWIAALDIHPDDAARGCRAAVLDHFEGKIRSLRGGIPAFVIPNGQWHWLHAARTLLL